MSFANLSELILGYVHQRRLSSAVMHSMYKIHFLHLQCSNKLNIHMDFVRMHYNNALNARQQPNSIGVDELTQKDDLLFIFNNKNGRD